MQEEVENRSVTLVVSGSKFTDRLLRSAIAKYMAHRKEKKVQRDRAASVKPKGKQTVKELVGQGEGTSSIEISDPSIRDFDRIARKYGVDYAVKKDRGASPPKYLVFFKARDTDALNAAFSTPWPSFLPQDMILGVLFGFGVWLAVYLKGKNAKKYRHGMEYGSARWGTAADIAPYIDPVFSNNIILTQTERLTMNGRPKDPKTARNKNVLIVGGSGSGKTRFWLKPNLMQMHSSYVVTDPKG